MTEQRRRRIDVVLDPSFLERLASLEAAEVRSRLRDARTEEDAISYVRRNLHGRLDLLRAELELRRGGRGTTRDVEALTEALTAPGTPARRGGRSGLALQAAAVAGRRRSEQVLSEDHLARLPDLSDQEIDEAIARIAEAERQLSADRKRLHEVIDSLESELASRYKDGLEPSLERLL